MFFQRIQVFWTFLLTFPPHTYCWCRQCHFYQRPCCQIRWRKPPRCSSMWMTRNLSWPKCLRIKQCGPWQSQWPVCSQFSWRSLNGINGILVKPFQRNWMIQLIQDTPHIPTYRFCLEKAYVVTLREDHEQVPQHSCSDSSNIHVRSSLCEKDGNLRSISSESSGRDIALFNGILPWQDLKCYIKNLKLDPAPGCFKEPLRVVTELPVGWLLLSPTFPNSLNAMTGTKDNHAVWGNSPQQKWL